jgi:hypothetical protein
MRVGSMRLLLVVAVTAWLVVDVGCSSDTSPSGMTVTVQKWDPVNQCFATMVGDPLPAFAPNNSAQDGRAQACPVGSPHLVASVDQVRMVIGYGDLKFGSSTSPPAPTVTMTLDGVLTPTGASITLTQGVTPTVFVAAFMAPGRVVNEMDLFASVTAGFDHPPVGPLSVSGPNVSVSVPQCVADAAACDAIVAGVGSVSVVVSAPGTASSTGTITWTLNGIPQAGSTPLNLAPDPNTVNTITGVAFVPVPGATSATQWALTAQVGLGSGNAPNITLVAPVVRAAVEDCPDAGNCTLTADVGLVAVLVSAPGIASAAMPVSGTVTTTIDGVPQQSAFPVTLAAAPNQTNVMAGIAYVPVPAATDGAIWGLGAQVGTVFATVPSTIVLRAPTVVPTLQGCAAPPTPCSVAEGSAVSFTVQVPIGMSAQQVTISTMVGNAVDIGSLVVNLSMTDIDGKTISGTATLTAPTQSGATWLINANVGGYNAPTVRATIQ